MEKMEISCRIILHKTCNVHQYCICTLATPCTGTSFLFTCISASFYNWGLHQPTDNRRISVVIVVSL